MFRHALCSAIVLGAVLAGSSPARAENRLALVIGESAYRAVPSLPNPANDARAMSKLLADSGFKVTTAADLSQKEMNQKVSDFTAAIASKGPDTAALVFYAGHGIQIDGENYLVPVDVDPKREADIPLQAVRLNDVLNTLSSVPTRIRILLLDACRDNPFPALNESVGRGLALGVARAARMRPVTGRRNATDQGDKAGSYSVRPLHDGGKRCNRVSPIVPVGLARDRPFGDRGASKVGAPSSARHGFRGSVLFWRMGDRRRSRGRQFVENIFSAYPNIVGYVGGYYQWPNNWKFTGRIAFSPLAARSS